MFKNKISTDFSLSYTCKNNIPIFLCDYCGKCDSLEAQNQLGMNRGCCWYFPKYTLLDIKNTLDNGNKEFILTLKTLKNSIVKKYSIEVTGYFDVEGYEKFCSEHFEDSDLDKDNFDKSLFFKRCFFSGEKGCSIDFSRRSHPCNLYICRNILDKCSDGYSKFNKERKDYFSYVHYMNIYLENELKNQELNLVDNYLEVVSFLEEIHIDNFEPMLLDKLSFK